MQTPWTLEDLAARMRAVLETTGLAEGAAKANGQVSDVPNARTVRYYTTIGVLDRPAQQGRVAMYGRRHLEQLVAIKRLQAGGKTLADIQRTLIGLDDAELEKLAALPADLEAEAHGPAERPAPSRRDQAFWSAAAPTPAPATSVTGIQLENGVTLTFPAARTVTEDDQEALRAALLSVVDTLRARGLL